MKKNHAFGATAVAVAAVAILIASGGCNSNKPVPATDAGDIEPKPQTFKHENPEPHEGRDWFEDVTEKTGIKFTYKNGEEVDHLAIIESLGGGVAAFDFDGDGLLDLFFVGGGHYEGKTVLGHPGKLYRNLGDWKFEDVTEKVGVHMAVQYTHGVAVADVDRDGFPDLLVTGYDQFVLYMNRPGPAGKRVFENVTEQAGLTERLWSSGAAFADLDGDGYPDLYVCHYGDWGFETNHPTICTYDGKTRDVCPPKKFKALPHKIYRNKRDGTFEDVSEKCVSQGDGKPVSGLRTDGKGLGVLVIDVNNDGKPDLYVANDTDDNFLYLNMTKAGGPMVFQEISGIAGVNRDNRAQTNGSMGLDVGDPVRSGKPSIFVTNYEGELHALYVNRTDMKVGKPGEDVIFDFESHRNGINLNGPVMVGWATAFTDLDRDGWEDLIIMHGHAIRYPKPESGRSQYAKIMLNKNGRFERASQVGGSYFKTLHNARGAAFADLDNDGKLDFVSNHLNEPASVVRNSVPTENHWVGFALTGEKNRSIAGARVDIEVGDQKYSRFVKAGGSYASSNDPRVIFGIAKGTKVDKVTVQWPWGKVQTWSNLKADQYWTLTEGVAAAK